MEVSHLSFIAASEVETEADGTMAPEHLLQIATDFAEINTRRP